MSMENNQDKIEQIIEGVLFAAGEAIKISDLSELFGKSIEEMQNIVNELSNSYHTQARGIQLIEIDGAVQLCTKPEFYEYIEKLVRPRFTQGLSQAALEALSIVAYHQPVTRATVEYIRGVNSDGVINRLLERGMIEEKGRSDAVGHPILYGTTLEFLRAFGLNDLSQLPPVELPQTEEEQENKERTDEIPVSEEG